MIRALVVEDSRCARDLLVRILESDGTVQVVGAVSDGEEALTFLESERPDVITMDVHLPRLDGMETTRRIMATHPIPIVIVSSSWQKDDADRTFHALEAGAVAVADKPRGGESAEAKRSALELLQTVKAMAEVRLVRRRNVPSRSPVVKTPARPRKATPAVVAIGLSTGGPPVLQTILRELPKDFGIPLLVVQHIAPGFIRGMAHWLSDTTGFPVVIAHHHQPTLPGHAYLAPDGHHLGIDEHRRIILDDAPAENGLRPAVSYLFRSVLAAYGPAAIGVLLTGMGRDGAVELKSMRDRGASTIAQDEATSVVHGMPGEAIRLDAASYILPPSQIASALVKLALNHHP
jgi:two-component system chemotaxis response regulator CheB